MFAYTSDQYVQDFWHVTIDYYKSLILFYIKILYYIQIELLEDNSFI